MGENSASFTFCVSNSNMVQESDSCGTTLSFKVNVLEEDVAKNGSFLPHPQIHSYLHILLVSYSVWHLKDDKFKKLFL